MSGLTAGTAYTFTVVASNVFGSSLPSSASNPITATTVPPAPTIGTAYATGATSANVAYTAPANNGGLTITRYPRIQPLRPARGGRGEKADRTDWRGGAMKKAAATEGCAGGGAALEID